MSNFLLLFYGFGVAAVVCAAAFAVWARHRWQWSVPTWMPIVLMGGSGYLGVAAVVKNASLHTYVDLAHWLSVLQSIITTGKPLSLSHAFIIPGTLNYFSAHFTPLLYLIALPFALIPHASTLIVVSVALMLSSAYPLYRLALTMHRDRRLALIIASALLWYPTFQYITLYEFEMLRFAIPALLWMLWAWEARRFRWFFFFALLSCLVREEVGLTVAMFGVYIFFVAHDRRRGILTFLLGSMMSVGIIKGLMPFFSGAREFEHVAGGIFASLGGSPMAILETILRHPLHVARHIFAMEKVANIGMYLLPLLGISLLAPTALIGAVANVGIGLLSDSFAHTSYFLYYLSPSIPFFFYAFLKAWPRFLAVLGRWGRVRASDCAPAGMAAVFAAVLTSTIIFGPSPISLQFWFRDLRPAPFRTLDFHRSAYIVTDHHRRADTFTREIPDDAIVSAQQFLHPRLAAKRGLMVYPQLATRDGRFRADYAFIDTTNNGLRSVSPAFVDDAALAIVRTDPVSWELLRADDGFELYRRR